MKATKVNHRLVSLLITLSGKYSLFYFKIQREKIIEDILDRVGHSFVLWTNLRPAKQNMIRRKREAKGTKWKKKSSALAEGTGPRFNRGLT